MNQNVTLPARRSKRRIAGSSLAEMMIAMVLFALVSMGLGTSFIQQRKRSENAMNHAMADSMAQGLLEQIRRAGFASLGNMTPAFSDAPADCPVSGTETVLDPSTGASVNTYRSVELKFLGVDADNYATVQTFNLYWASDPANVVQVGARADPDDPSSEIFGVVLDVDHRNAANEVLRPRRYMPMRVSVTRSLNADKNAVFVTLRYQWAKPLGRDASGIPFYYPAREVHAVVSKISTY